MSEVEPSGLPKQPMASFPGTHERVFELEKRAARGEHLWHPDDRTNFHGFEGDFYEDPVRGRGKKNR